MLVYGIYCLKAATNPERDHIQFAGNHNDKDRTRRLGTYVGAPGLEMTLYHIQIKLRSSNPLCRATYTTKRSAISEES